MVELVQEATEISQKILEQYTNGRVVNLQLCVKHFGPMKQVKTVHALENRGLQGDRHAMPDSLRQVLLLEQETCVEFGFAIGALRENITTRGIDLMSLPGKTQLQIGEAIFETTKECEPCSFVESIKDGLREELQHKRGMLVRVVRGGEIKLGDTIRILQK